VISDILESNGSSSMASVCGATLGLMAAGVPITNPVAGISTGLVKEGERWVLLTDIIGDEDHYGDMDFKIAGTQNGITGIQLDLKIAGISEEIVRAALVQSREARIEILRSMLSAIARPRPNTAPTAPRLVRTKIDPEKIGLLIGPGGKHIRGLQEDHGVTIDVEEDGTVTIAGEDEASVNQSKEGLEAVWTALSEFDRILGLFKGGLPRSQDDVPEQIEALRLERDKAKKEKNFQRADEIRRKINDQGFTIIDTHSGSTIRKL